MTTEKYFKSDVGRNFLLTIFALLIVMVIATACNLPGSEPEESAEPVDPDAQLYRMYFDSSADLDENELQIRYFDGQIRMADTQVIFGDTDELPRDEYGNYVGGPELLDGLVWSLVVSPSQMGVNLVSSDLDGTVSSAIDLDGDGSVDILDIRLPDGRRISFVTELLGMGVFEAWLLGRNPLCNTDLGQDLGFAIWGCGEDEEGNGEGSGVGGGAAPGGGYVDPFDLICSEYDTSRPNFSGQVMTNNPRSTWLPINNSYSEYNFFGEDGDQGSSVSHTVIYGDGRGNHVWTLKITYDFDGRGELLQTTTEVVQNDGRGYRHTVTKDGLSTREPIVVNLDEDGDYEPAESVPPPDRPPIDPRPGDEPAEPPPEAADEGNPGPEGDDSAIADFCERRESHVSGVEQAAATDPTAFQVSCNDLVGAPASGDDCMIIDWARSGDFRGALEPSGSDCGPFEQPDEDGNCSGTSIASRLRGLTAMVASANLAGGSICGGVVCRPPDSLAAAAENRQATSGEAPEEGFATVTPGPSSLGTIPEITLCYWGPGAAWGTVSSLTEGLLVEIVGVGEVEGWLIVVNPNYEGVTCWVDEDDIELPPGLDPDMLPVFDTPALPDDGGDDGGGSPAAPGAPSGLQAKFTYGSPCINELTWNDISNNESGFNIYRDGQKIGAVGPNVTTFTDNNASATDGYSYTVRAYNDAGESSSSNSVNSEECFG